MQILKPQKVLHLKDALALKAPKTQGMYMLTPKLDGWWVTIPYSKAQETWYTPVSSAGRTIPAFEHLLNHFNNYLPKPKENCYLIAEAIIPDTPFEILNGVFNRSVGNCACDDAVFYVHNLVFPQRIQLTAIERWKLLQQLDLQSSMFSKMPLLYAGNYDADIWKHYFDYIIDREGEGIVAQRETAIYQPGKRNADLLKLKLECTVDCLAVALEETVGKKDNDGLVLISKRANGTEIRTVISKHKDKELFRKDRSAIIGKVVEIKAMEELPDGQLRQPVFKYVRYDKLPHEIN